MALPTRIVHATPKLEELAECVMEEFRAMNENRTGMQNFAGMWFEHIMIAAQTKKGGKEVLEACKSIMRMVRDVSLLEQGREKGGPEILTDQELEEEIKLLIPTTMSRIVEDNGLQEMQLKPREIAEAMGLEEEYDAAQRSGTI